jgi:RNase P subunit RPR2
MKDTFIPTTYCSASKLDAIHKRGTCGKCKAPFVKSSGALNGQDFRGNSYSYGQGQRNGIYTNWFKSITCLECGKKYQLS